MTIREGIDMSEEDAAEFDRLNDIYEYHNRIQHVYKIKLNSLYGALVNVYFRYYNLSNGESTTATGRMILLHQCAAINQFITGIYDHAGEVILAGDTDSTYFLTKATNVEDAIRIADETATYANSTHQGFMSSRFLCNPGFDNLIRGVRELVADRVILVKKKKYIFNVVDQEGHRVDKMKVTGLDIKKTTIPKEISKKLNEFIKRLLKGEDWDSQIAPDVVTYKNELINNQDDDEFMTDLELFGVPMGVKGVEKYTEDFEAFGNKARIPGHTSGAIFWNMCLEENKDLESPRIMSGDKIGVYYMKSTFGRFKCISMPKDIEVIPEWFIREFLPLIDKKLQLEKNVDGPLTNILKAIGKEAPTNQSLLRASLLVF